MEELRDTELRRYKTGKVGRKWENEMIIVSDKKLIVAIGKTPIIHIFTEHENVWRNCQE